MHNISPHRDNECCFSGFPQSGGVREIMELRLALGHYHPTAELN